MLLKQFLFCLLIYHFLLLLLMVNGSPETSSNHDVKHPYPFSKAQLESKVDQHEMDKRIEDAKHWNKKLEQILIKYKNNLKSFYSANGELKSREEYIRDAFMDAIKNKNLLDLTEILVTATAEEKETFKNLKYCEQLKKIFKKDLMEILFALCENQRETTFDLQREKGEIEKDREAIKQVALARKELTKIFSTKSYDYLREMFNNNKYTSRWHIEVFSDQAKFWKVAYFILRDALDGRPEFLSFLLYDSLEVLNYKRKNFFKKKLFVNYAKAHKAFQRILATRAQIDLADIVKVDKDNNKSLGSFGHAIGTLKAIQRSTKGEEKKLFEAYIEILEFVRETAKIDKSEEKTIRFDSGRVGTSGEGFLKSLGNLFKHNQGGGLWLWFS